MEGDTALPLMSEEDQNNARSDDDDEGRRPTKVARIPSNEHQQQVEPVPAELRHLVDSYGKQLLDAVRNDLFSSNLQAVKTIMNEFVAKCRGDEVATSSNISRTRLQRLLIEFRDKSGDSHWEHDMTPLMMASYLGFLDVVKFLVAEMDADVFATLNCRNHGWHKNTAIHFAADQGHKAVLSFLLEHEPSLLELKNADNDTPLNCAVFGVGRLDCVEFLVDDKKARIENRGWNRETPLTHSAIKGYFSIFKFLLQKGADAYAKGTSGHMAIHYAAEKGHLEIVAALLQHDPSLVTAKGKYSNLPLWCAERGGQQRVAKYLREKQLPTTKQNDQDNDRNNKGRQRSYHSRFT